MKTRDLFSSAPPDALPRTSDLSPAPRYHASFPWKRVDPRIRSLLFTPDSRTLPSVNAGSMESVPPRLKFCATPVRVVAAESPKKHVISPSPWLLAIAYRLQYLFRWASRYGCSENNRVSTKVQCNSSFADAEDRYFSMTDDSGSGLLVARINFNVDEAKETGLTYLTVKCAAWI